MALHTHGYLKKYPVAGYVMAALVGAIIFSGYWWFTERFESSLNTPSEPAGRKTETTGIKPGNPTTETTSTTDSLTAHVTRHGVEDKVGAKVEHPNSSPPNVPPKLSRPDVRLRFVYPHEPALIITNTSDSVARNIKWAVELWNMDMPDRNDPLPIPISTFDWIKAHGEGGPQNLFGGPLIAPLLKSGVRLFGSASVDCPECTRGRTYIVYIVLGQGGWFSEVEGEKLGRIATPKNFLRETREAYFATLEATVPANKRITIGEL